MCRSQRGGGAGGGDAARAPRDAPPEGGRSWAGRRAAGARGGVERDRLGFASRRERAAPRLLQASCPERPRKGDAAGFSVQGPVPEALVRANDEPGGAG